MCVYISNLSHNHINRILASRIKDLVSSSSFCILVNQIFIIFKAFPGKGEFGFNFLPPKTLSKVIHRPIDQRKTESAIENPNKRDTKSPNVFVDDSDTQNTKILR